MLVAGVIVSATMYFQAESARAQAIAEGEAYRQIKEIVQDKDFKEKEEKGRENGID